MVAVGALAAEAQRIVHLEGIKTILVDLLVQHHSQIIVDSIVCRLLRPKFHLVHALVVVLLVL